MTAPQPGDWPLSAAATALLREPGLRGDAVLKLALRELVLRGVVLAELGEPPCRDGQLTLRPGGRSATGLPVPLPRLARALLPHVPADGAEASTVVQQSVAGRYQLLDELRTEARDTLTAQGLLTAQRSRVLGVIPRTRWLRSPTGELWAAVPRGLERDRGAAVAAAAGSAAPAVGLLLALDAEVARALRDDGDASVLFGIDGDLDGRTLDAVLGDVGTGLDGAVDGGGSGSSDGGDGGGGGD